MTTLFLSVVLCAAPQSTLPGDGPRPCDAQANKPAPVAAPVPAPAPPPVVRWELLLYSDGYYRWTQVRPSVVMLPPAAQPMPPTVPPPVYYVPEYCPPGQP